MIITFTCNEPKCGCCYNAVGDGPPSDKANRHGWVQQKGGSYKCPFHARNLAEFRNLSKKSMPIRSTLEALLIEHGGKEMLATLGDILKCIESAGNGYRVGDAIELLSQIEW